MKQWLGIDVGGTKIFAALIDEQGQILAQVRESTSQNGVQALVAQIANIAAQLDPEGKVQGIGVGMPGAVCPRTQALLWIPNIAGVQGDAFAPALRAAFRVPVVIENDVNAAALGEAWLGQSGNPLVLLALGTGTGMGVVINDRLCRGHRGAAGEVAYLPLGAHPLTADKHKKAAFEQRLGGAGWLAAYRAAGGDGTRSLADLFAEPDEVFNAVFAESVDLLTHGILAISAVLDPEIVLLGGSIGLQPALLSATQERLRAYGNPLTIAPAQLGQHAGALGAGRAAILNGK